MGKWKRGRKGRKQKNSEVKLEFLSETPRLEITLQTTENIKTGIEMSLRKSKC